MVDSSVLHHFLLDAALKKIDGLLKSGGRAGFAEPTIFNPQVFEERSPTFLRRWFWSVSADEAAFARRQLQQQLQGDGFVETEIRPFDWLRPSTPERLVNTMERVPLAREFAGSWIVRCYRPR